MSVTELNKAAFIKPSPRNSASLGGVDNGLSARSKADVMREIAKLGNFRFHIEWTVVNGGENQLKSFVDARQAELFFRFRLHALSKPLQGFPEKSPQPSFDEIFRSK
jgi:hypothetical protein